VIVGNPIYLDSNIVSYKKDGNSTTFLSIGKFFKHLITLENGSYHVVHSKLDDISPSSNRTSDLTYGDYQEKDGRIFATSRSLTVAEKSKIDVNMDFKQFAFNETLDFPFSVPKNYKKK
jgi:Domain of unknown function (DUF4292)